MKIFTKMSKLTQSRMTKKMGLWLMLLITAFSSLQAQMVTVTPAEFTEGMKNPLMGLREGVSEAKNRLPYNTVVRCYVYYNELDNAPTDGLQKILDYTNTKFKDFEKWNIKVIVRVILQYTGTQYYWPADLNSIKGDYTNATLRARVLKTVDNMGKAWDNDPRIAWVEMGLIGQWGEQESPMGIDEPGVKPDGKSWVQILAPAFKAAFTNKKVEARHMSKWDGTGFVGGMYWDSWGSYSSMTNASYDYNAELIKYNNAPYNRYKTSPMGGEIAYSLGVMRPELIGTDADDSYKDAGHRRWIKNVAASIRTSVLGMEYSSTDMSAAALEGLKDLQKGFGYRFLIKEFQCTQQTQAGGNLTVNAKIVNEGVAPFYDKWPVAFVLIDPNTKQIVYKSVIPSADVTTWMPGENYDWKTAATLPGTGTEKYLIPAAINNISATVTIPANLATGTYLAGLAILDPTTDLPGVFFSVKNFYKASNTHPLCQIGVGVAPSNPTLTNVTFDNYDFATDSRYYSLTPPANVPVTSVSVAPTTLSLIVGGTSQLTATVLPSNASNKNVTWTSNSSNATVSSSGLVTGVALGSAVITATTADGNFTATCNVTVNSAPACSLPWSTPDFSLGMGSAPYSSGAINISCATSVKLHMELSENDFFEAEDNLTVSYKVNGGATIQIVQLVNDFNTGYVIDIPTISGNSLEILITGLTHDALEIYYIKNISVTSNGTSVKQDQTISFAAIAPKTFGTADFNPGATASSGLAVTYASSNTAVATIVSGNIHIVGVGTSDITASQAGNTSYNAAPSVVQTLTVNKANQTITFPAIAAKVVGAADFNPGATASSGLAVTYTSSNTAVATIVSGNIHIVAAGTSIITASQAGNASYNAAPSVVQTLTVNTVQSCSLPWSTPDFSLGMGSAPYSSGAIDISCVSFVKLHIELSETDFFEAEDNLTVSYKVNGGAAIQIVQLVNDFNTGYIVDIPNLSGNTLEILITGVTHDALEIYYIKNMNVTQSGACTDNLPWAKADITVNNATITNQSQGVVNTSCASTVTITADVEGLGGLDLADYCRMQYKVNGGTTLQTLFDINNLAGAFAKKLFTKTVTATSVELVLNAKNTSADEIYKITNIKITSNGLKSASIATNIEMANNVEDGVRIYPNPASGILNIDFPNAEMSREIKVFNMVGQLIHSVQTKNASAQINVQLLKLKGIVVVQVIAGNTISNHRILIK